MGWLVYGVMECPMCGGNMYLERLGDTLFDYYFCTNCVYSIRNSRAKDLEDNRGYKQNKDDDRVRG